MSFRNTATSYGSVAKFFHWVISFLVIVMLCVGYFLGDVPKEWQPMAYNLHKLTGLTILLLVVLRALWALVNPKPSLPRGALPWERSAEKIGHVLMYVLVMAMPLAGWIGASAAGHPPHIGSCDIALPLRKNESLAGFAFDVHGIVAIMLIIFIVGHVSVALYHHFIKKDDVLRRMLP